MYSYVLAYAATTNKTRLYQVSDKSLKGVIRKGARHVIKTYYQGDEKAIDLRFKENSDGKLIYIENKSFDTPQKLDMWDWPFDVFDKQHDAIPGLTEKLGEWFGINFDCIVAIKRVKDK